MKKNNFKKQIETKMQSMGYKPILFYSFNIAFTKKVNDDFYLTIVVYFSKFDSESFTGDFYLSWFPNYLNIDSPDSVYFKRIGEFLTVNERKCILNNVKENVSKVCIDAWWYMSDIDVVDKFISAIDICEPRFLSQNNIFEDVKKSRVLLDLQKRILDIIDLAQDEDYKFPALFYQPKSNPFKIDPVWYKASEIICSKSYVSKQVVLNMAIKAFNYYTFRQLYGNYLLENK